MKVCGVCGEEIMTKDGENHCEDCLQAEANAQLLARRKRIRDNRRSRDEAMKSLGLVKVRGAMGGTYWE